MRKITLHNILIFAIGLTILSLGVTLGIRSRLGISVALSVPYVYSLHFTKMTLGQWNYIVQGFIILLLVLIVKRLTFKYLASFIVAFLFGLEIDLFGKILAPIVANTLLARVGLSALGTLGISVGVALLIKSGYPILPFDAFVYEVSVAKDIAFPRVKTLYDIVSFIVSFISSLIFFKAIRGLHVGTLAAALVMGNLIGIFHSIFDRYIEGVSIIPEEKKDRALNYQFLNFGEIEDGKVG